MKKSVVLVFVSLVIALMLVLPIFADKYKPEKITFIHYKDGKVKTIDNNARVKAETCYKLLGVKWTSFPVSYVINPSNLYYLSESFVTNAVFLGAEEWDEHTSKELFANSYSINYSATWDDVTPDYNNEYVFGFYPEPGVIAVTNVWGYFSAPKPYRRIIEYDVLFNNYYAWGDGALNSSVMDLQNIAAHETGHGIGLADLYNACVQETMYGYSDYGETSKRDLNSGDIAGIKKLYS